MGKNRKMNTVKERVESILARPMSRGQFIKSVGLLLLAAVGITNLLNTLEGGRSRQSSVGSSGGSAYGSSVYEGGQKPVV